MNDHPDELDRRIDEALIHIGAATPPDGMQMRVLRRAREAQSEWARPLQAPPWRFALAAACAVVMVGLVFSKDTFSISRDEAHISQSRASVEKAAIEPLPVVRRAVPHGIPAAIPRRNPASVVGRIDAPPQSEAGDPYVMRTSDAASAPSQPAPQLPLTSQEKLLVAAAHRQTLPQTAGLRRPVWPLRDPAEDEDFKKFFDSQIPLATDGENE